MPLVEMAHLRADIEGPQQAPACDAQHYFLLQAQLRPAAVEFAGDGAVRGKVSKVVGVQQVNECTPDVRLPAANPEFRKRQSHGNAQPFAALITHRLDRKLPRIIEGKEGLLRAIAIDFL